MTDGLIDDIRGKERYMGVAITIIEAEQEDDQALATAQELIDVEFELRLDSGSTDNVCHPFDDPGYIVGAPHGGKRGQK